MVFRGNLLFKDLFIVDVWLRRGGGVLLFFYSGVYLGKVYMFIEFKVVG